MGLQMVAARVLRHEKWLRSEMRVKLNTGKVAQYAAEKKQGAHFPAPVVFVDPDGIYWTGDGFHRVEAEVKNGASKVEVFLKAGTLKDAIIWNLRANRESHGLPFSQGDVTKAVKFMLKDKLFKDLPRSRMAELIGCTAGMVSRVALQSGFPRSGMGQKPIIDAEEVARRVVAGESKEEIAKDLNVGLRTIYRADVRAKFQDCPHCNGTGKILKKKAAS